MLDEDDNDNAHYFPQSIIAGFYEKGLYGIPQNQEKARYWYGEAANFGSGDAVSKITELTELKVECSELRRRAFSRIKAAEKNETDNVSHSTQDDREEWRHEDRIERGQLQQEGCIIS